MFLNLDEYVQMMFSLKVFISEMYSGFYFQNLFGFCN